MSVEYSGLPSIARRYWNDYSYAVLAMATLILFTGAIGAVVILTFIPAAKWFFLIGSVSFVLHSAALFLRDVWTGEYEPSQTTFSSVTELLALVVILGTVFSTILLIGSAGSYLLAEVFAWPKIVGVALAAYYPVIEIILMRHYKYTPGSIVFVGAVLAVSAVVNIHQSIIDILPIIGNSHRPHS